MFLTLFQILEVHCKVHNEICKPVCKVSNLIGCFLTCSQSETLFTNYKPACEFYCELLNFAMNFRSSEHFSEKLIEIECEKYCSILLQFCGK